MPKILFLDLWPMSLARNSATLPFDFARHQYAWAAWAGLVPRSMLHSARFEKFIDGLEKRMLGGWARQR